MRKYRIIVMISGHLRSSFLDLYYVVQHGLLVARFSENKENQPFQDRNGWVFII